MDVDPIETAGRCGCMRGVILVTRCGAVAVGRCSHCHVAVCAEHAASWAGLLFCTACMSASKRADTQSTGDVVFVDSSSEPLWQFDPDPPTPTNGTHQPSPAAPSRDDEPFTAEDYEAFDEVGDADMNAGLNDGFDS